MVNSIVINNRDGTLFEFEQGVFKLAGTTYIQNVRGWPTTRPESVIVDDRATILWCTLVQIS